jgi:ssDNA-binding Zn-finger/Zn-ribbon topoisomerase 1
MKNEDLGTRNICPYCNKKLDKMPLKKTKCIFCSNFIYSRTVPYTNEKLLFREDQIPLLEAKWNLYMFSKRGDFYVSEQELEKERLKYKKNISNVELIVNIFNDDAKKFRKNKQLGLYRNLLINICQYLISEKDFNQALDYLLKVLYLDINGSQNVPNFKLDFVINEFDKKNSFFANGLINVLNNFILILNISINDVKNRFFVVCKDLKFNTIPYSINESWDLIYSLWHNNQKLILKDVSNIDLIYEDILILVNAKKFNDAIILIDKIRSKYYKTKKEYPDAKYVQKLLSFLLWHKSDFVVHESEKLLLSFAKKDYENAKKILQKYASKIVANPESYFKDGIIGQIARIDLNLIKPIIPCLKINLKENSSWEIRRVLSFNLGNIGSVDPELIKDIIPIMVDYIKKPYIIKEKDNSIKFKLFGKELSLNVNLDNLFGDIDPKEWLKDAYIDSLGLIAKTHKDVIRPYENILKDIAKNDKSEYSRKKANEVLSYLY